MTVQAQTDNFLSVSSCNLEYGGLSESLGDSRWHRSMACLVRWKPGVLLMQEHNGRGPARLNAHAWRTANELGMTPLIGPASPDSVSGNHPAVLVDTRAGLRILDAGPPPALTGPTGPAWCEVLVQVPGMPHPVWFVSVHLPARSAASQRIQAERLASLLAQRGGLVVVGGDWNSYAPTDDIPPDALHKIPAHLRPSRMRRGHGGTLEPDYAVHYTLASIGLADAAAELPAQQREPNALTPTGVTPCGRIDRIYVTSSMVPALDCYEQAQTGGSDHQALLLTFNTAATKGVTPPPPLP